MRVKSTILEKIINQKIIKQAECLRKIFSVYISLQVT